MEIIEQFLGCKMDEGIIDPSKHVSYTYRSNKLVYGFGVDFGERILMVSADFQEAFGYACISEVCAEFDEISIETEPEYYGDDQILTCRKNYPGRKGVVTLQVKKWGNGELSIWMARVSNRFLQASNES